WRTYGPESPRWQRCTPCTRWSRSSRSRRSSGRPAATSPRPSGCGPTHQPRPPGREGARLLGAAPRAGGAVSEEDRTMLALSVREDFVAAAVRPEVEACIRGVLADHL